MLYQPTSFYTRVRDVLSEVPERRQPKPFKTKHQRLRRKSTFSTCQRRAECRSSFCSCVYESDNAPSPIATRSIAVASGGKGGGR